jgi:Phosphotransferase enzyme family
LPISSAQFPDLQVLTLGFTSVFRSNGYTDGQVTVLDREPNIYTSSFPSEVVTCRFDDGSELQLLCKYGAEHAQGHWGGIAYEAQVYRHVLQPLPISAPKFYGAYMDRTTRKMLLILEYLHNTERLSNPTEPAAAMSLATRWLGQFHAANEARLSSTPMSFLKTYDAAYYLAAAQRMSIVAARGYRHFPWLTTLCKRFEECMASLLAPAPTIIHGEYVPENILVRDGIIYPVDWESAAIAVGEIDLAILTDRWPLEIVQQCVLEYRRTRWPQGAPADFERTFDAAQLYLHFLWLGYQPDSTTHQSYLWRFDPLRCAGERLGLI